VQLVQAHQLQQQQQCSSSNSSGSSRKACQPLTGPLLLKRSARVASSCTVSQHVSAGQL
jgi:hypothetical protein